jgi:aspartyl aminopeptidase
MKHTEGLFEFIKNSPSAYHAVNTVREMLEAEGYTELYESDRWKLAVDGKYYVIRNGTSLIAFRTVRDARGFMICASHSDAPTFRVKITPEAVGAYTRLEVEKYGGMIYYTWLDRPLSVAGRVILRTPDGVESRLVNLDTDLLTIPSLAIHLNRGVNDGAKFNPAKDLLPLYSSGAEKGDLVKSIAEQLGVDIENILSHDLFLYNRDEGRRVGKDGEFILCPRLDDLGCVYTSTVAFLAARGAQSLPVLAIFDNEEVGSETKQGAASTFLRDTLLRISGSDQSLAVALENSFMLSADNAHAKHPAYPEMSDPDNAPVLNSGVVIKYNASQRYTTDGLSDALFRTVCKRAGVKVQTYCNRADLPGGSTLGSISNTRVSVPTVDIGLPQLAMHSANETAGAHDIDSMISAITEFYSTTMAKKGTKVYF